MCVWSWHVLVDLRNNIWECNDACSSWLLCAGFELSKLLTNAWSTNLGLFKRYQSLAVSSWRLYNWKSCRAMRVCGQWWHISGPWFCWLAISVLCFFCSNFVHSSLLESVFCSQVFQIVLYHSEVNEQTIFQVVFVLEKFISVNCGSDTSVPLPRIARFFAYH